MKCNELRGTKEVANTNFLQIQRLVDRIQNPPFQTVLWRGLCNVHLRQPDFDNQICPGGDLETCDGDQRGTGVSCHQ